MQLMFFTAASQVAPAVFWGMGIVRSGGLTTMSGKMSLDTMLVG